MSCDLFPAHPQILFCSRSSSPDWDEPVDKMSDSEGSTHPPPTSTSASALHPSAHTTHPPRTVSKGPVPRPPQPTQAARPTEPPFIGDTYMSEDVPPQTVSSCVSQKDAFCLNLSEIRELGLDTGEGMDSFGGGADPLHSLYLLPLVLSLVQLLSLFEGTNTLFLDAFWPSHGRCSVLKRTFLQVDTIKT